MRSDRNQWIMDQLKALSLVDWEMRSDRNDGCVIVAPSGSLVDWEMRSDRNLASPTI